SRRPAAGSTRCAARTATRDGAAGASLAWAARPAVGDANATGSHARTARFILIAAQPNMVRPQSLARSRRPDPWRFRPVTERPAGRTPSFEIVDHVTLIHRGNMASTLQACGYGEGGGRCGV